MSKFFIIFLLLCLLNVINGFADDIKSYNGQTKCDKYQKVFVPQTILQLKQIIQSAFSEGTKIRFLGSRHSASSILCGDGYAVLTSHFNKIHGILHKNGQSYVEVESGVKMGELADFLDQEGFTLGFAYPYYREVTVGGVLGTGAHGTSLKHPASISSIVSKIDFIDGKGELKEVDEENNLELLKALRVNLGVLGFVYKVQLPILPQFNLHGSLSFISDDHLFNQAQGLERLGRSCDHVFLAWFPKQSQIVKYCANQTTEGAREGAQNVFLDDELTDKQLNSMKFIYGQGRKIDLINCSLDKIALDSHKSSPKLVEADSTGNLVRVFETVAPSHRLLLSRSPLRNDIFVLYDFSLMFDIDKATAVLAEFKKAMNEQSLCFPTIGIHVRFINSNEESLIGTYHLSGTGPKAVIEFFDFIDPSTKKKNARVDAFVKMLMVKYAGHAHWGKNKDWQFPISINQSSPSVNKLSAFKTIQKQLDPKGIFVNSFFDQL